MLKHYETVFIMTPVLSDEQMKETVEKFEKFLLDNKCEIVHQENWGMRKLAYPILKKSSGFYHLFEFKAEPTFVKEWEVNFKRDERILRFLTVALDKYAIQFNERRRENKNNASKEAAKSSSNE
ncbi:MAG TPA: 30S ribosomal protein S6 [Bacteroidales bacterium]|jgi:small subunit ribosomal protein S6|nr:30S ribosomal protein S6 [Bacteroidales bacterium]